MTGIRQYRVAEMMGVLSLPASQDKVMKRGIINITAVLLLGNAEKRYIDSEKGFGSHFYYYPPLSIEDIFKKRENIRRVTCS